MTPETLLAWEPYIRMTAFGSVLAAMALLEWMAPRRSQVHSRFRRWPSNIGIVIVSALLVKIVIPITAVAFALWCERNGVGLLNWLAVPGWLAVVAAVLVLDLAIYVQHVVFHHVPMLWRLHRMHHADLELDVTSGTRFHPVEILLSMMIKLAVVGIIGAPALAVLIFEVLLNATAMFNHSNLKLPLGLDRIVRVVLVTPDMHRVHHSIVPRETHSNFGFNLAVWDRMFRTYRPQPEAGHDGMTIGLPVFRDPAELRLDRLLTQPWRGDGAERP